MKKDQKWYEPKGTKKGWRRHGERDALTGMRRTKERKNITGRAQKPSLEEDKGGAEN